MISIFDILLNMNGLFKSVKQFLKTYVETREENVNLFKFQKANVKPSTLTPSLMFIYNL